jgi:hypothetical protein
MAGERTKALGGWGCLPEARTQVNCNKGDGVCTGAFSISVAHLSYTADGSINKGVNFAAQVINGGKLEGNPDGACKYGLNIADLPRPEGGASGGAKGSPKGSPKGKGTGSAPKGSGPPAGGASSPAPAESASATPAPAESSSATPAPTEASTPRSSAETPAETPAESAAPAPMAGMAGHEGMEGM